MPRKFRSTAPFLEALLTAWYGLWSGFAHPYHPERYYMRGRGPKADGKREQD